VTGGAVGSETGTCAKVEMPKIEATIRADN
jgi:hypothetical protein